MLIPNKPLSYHLILSILFAFTIEFSQIYQADWINEIRNTKLGGLVLGYGFKVSDLIAYSVGVAFGFFINKRLIKKSNHKDQIINYFGEYKMFKKLIILLTLITVSGCATRNTPIDPSTFQSFEDNSFFELSEPLMYSEVRGLGFTWEQGLKAGVYKPKFQDDKGYYFVGPEKALCQGNPKCGEFVTNGGIWVSKKSKSDIRLFLIHELSDYQRKNAGLLVAMDDGKYFVFDKNAEFSKVLAKVKK